MVCRLEAGQHDKVVNLRAQSSCRAFSDDSQVACGCASVVQSLLRMRRSSYDSYVARGPASVDSCWSCYRACELLCGAVHCAREGLLLLRYAVQLLQAVAFKNLLNGA